MREAQLTTLSDLDIIQAHSRVHEQDSPRVSKALQKSVRLDISHHVRCEIDTSSFAKIRSPQPELGGRELEYPRGKLLGGCRFVQPLTRRATTDLCSSINVQLFQHCAPSGQSSRRFCHAGADLFRRLRRMGYKRCRGLVVLGYAPVSDAGPL